MIFYEAPHKLKATLNDFYETFGNRRICLAREMTKKFEDIYTTDLIGAIKKYEETVPKGEFVLIIEGAKEEEKDFSNLSVEEHVSMYEKSGMSENDAIKAAAKDRGVRKNEIYAIVKRKQQ